MNERAEIWLRFIGYKIAELLGVGILSIGSYYIGKLMNSWLPTESQVTGWFIYWLTGIFGLLILALISGGLVAWIMWNWTMAEDDTEARRKELRKKDKGKK